MFVQTRDHALFERGTQLELLKLFWTGFFRKSSSQSNLSRKAQIRVEASPGSKDSSLFKSNSQGLGWATMGGSSFT